jgi:hypothetical protein
MSNERPRKFCLSLSLIRGLTSQSNRVFTIIARLSRLGKNNFLQLSCRMHAFGAKWFFSRASPTLMEAVGGEAGDGEEPDGLGAGLGGARTSRDLTAKLHRECASVPT